MMKVLEMAVVLSGEGADSPVVLDKLQGEKKALEEKSERAKDCP